jgi:hypothetical protein
MSVIERLKDHWEDSRDKGLVERISSRPTFCFFACDENELRSFRRTFLTQATSATVMGRVVVGACPVINGMMERVEGRFDRLKEMITV